VTLDAAGHRATAVSLFNDVWSLLGQADRTPEDDDRMLHMAHASRYHWGQVGTAVNLVRGEWQCSRVYAELGRGEPARHHARRALDLCRAAGIGDFDLAFCYEAMARASAVCGDAAERDRWLALGREAAADVSDDEDRALVLADLDSVPPAHTPS
jgi:hypothetical protein